MVRTFAAIDVGSFELELGIYEITDKGNVRSVDQVKHMIALGKDTYNTGKISYRLVEEMCEVLQDFVRIMKEYQVKEYRAYATSAMREARNSQIVLEQLRVRTGIDVKIISNSEQRFISYKAIAAKDAEFQKNIQRGTAIVDVGFGSMQASLFDKDALVSTQNLPLGVLRLRELIAHEKLTQQGAQNLIAELIDNELVTYRKIYLKDREIKNLIGEPILSIHYKMAEGRRSEQITIQEFNRFYERLKGMTLAQTEDFFDVNEEYASLLFPTAAIYKRMLEITGAEFMWVPGIRMTDGMAAEYAEDKKLIRFNHSFENDIIVTSRNMAKRYKCYMPHIQNVEEAALKVFDSLKKYHGLGARERLLLQIAANLHSCGKFVTMRGSEECGYNMIMATEIIGLSHVEREIVANIVKYHQQKFRYNEVEVSAKPSKDSRLASTEDLSIVIAKLTAILRLANSMDRGHTGKLKDSRLNVKDGQLVIQTGCAADVTLESISIADKGDFFEEIFGIRPVLRQKRRV